MRRLSQGWALSKKSWSVLKENRGLARFPVYGGIASILALALLAGPGAYLFQNGDVAPGAPLVLLGIYLATFVGVYFNVGLAAAADSILRGQPAGFDEGMAVARSRMRAIAGWAALSATVGVVLNVIQNETGILGQVATRIVDVAWTLVTFLVIPVIAMEGTGPTQSLKRSASLFKQKWGQQLAGNLAIGGAVVLFGMIPAIVLVGAGFAIWSTASFAGALLFVIGAGVFVASIVIASALSGIFGVALYRYAVDGEAIGGFTQGEFDSAVLRKGTAPPSTI